MHCYRCGRRLPDRTPKCENCGQVFSYGDAADALDAAEADARSTDESPQREPSGETSTPGQLALPPSESPPQESRPVEEPPKESRDITAVSVQRPPVVQDTQGAPTSVSVQLPEGLPSEAREDIEANPELGLVVGDVLSKRLELTLVLGNGPVGTVFKARDKKKGTVVAVKVIPKARLKSGRDRARFDSAIASAKTLSHPNLARIYGAGRDDNLCFYLMPYLEGLPMRKLLDVKKDEGRPFVFEEAEPIVIQLCQAIHFAHRATIHGGLKPENIFVQVDSLKILDVGVSRAFPPKQFWRMQADVGMDAYLAPEYSWEEPRVDRRADVYSLGVILYEMLTSTLPDPGFSTASEVNEDLPKSVDRVLAKALALDPDERYPDADKLKQDVMRILGGDILADDLDQEESQPSIESDVSIGSVDIEVRSDSAAYEEDDGEDETTPGTPIPEDPPSGATEVPDEPSPSPIPPPEIEPVQVARRDQGNGRSEREERTPVGEVRPVEPLWVPDEVSEVSSASAAQPPEASAAIASATPSEPSDQPGTPSWLERDPQVPVPLDDPVSKDSEPSDDPSAPDLPLVTGQLDDEPIPLRDEASPLYDQPVADDRTTGKTKPEAEIAEDRNSERATRAIPERQNDRATNRLAEPPGPPYDPREDKATEQVSGPPPIPPRPVFGPDRSELDDDRREPAFTQPPTSPRRPQPSRPPARPGPSPRRDDEPFRLRRSRTGSRFVFGMIAILVVFTGLAFFATTNWESLMDTFKKGLASWTGRNTPAIPAGEVCPRDMITVPAGSFLIGSKSNDRDRDITELVQQRVNVATYCIDLYEYPNAEGTFPRIALNWQAADEQCRQAGKRLCNEVEWERACKGPSSTRYPYGDNFVATQCNLGAGPKRIQKIGASSECTSGFGVHDMSGNAWEWTSDRFKPALDDDEMVIKGGSSQRPSWAGRCAYREAAVSTQEDDEIGFRCCLDAQSPG